MDNKKKIYKTLH